MDDRRQEGVVLWGVGGGGDAWGGRILFQLWRYIHRFVCLSLYLSPTISRKGQDNNLSLPTHTLLILSVLCLIGEWKEGARQGKGEYVMKDGTK